MRALFALALFFLTAFHLQAGQADATHGLTIPPPEQPSLKQEFYRQCLTFIRAKSFKKAYVACDKGYQANEWWSWWGLVRLNQAFDFDQPVPAEKIPDPYVFLIESQCLLHYKHDPDKARTLELCASSTGKRGHMIAERLRQDLRL